MASGRGFRRHLHRPVPVRRGERPGGGLEGAVHPGRPQPRDRRGRRGRRGASRRHPGGRRLLRARDDGGHQRADPAPRGADRPHHDGRVPRPAGDRAAEAPRPLRHAGRQAAGAGQPGPAAGGGGAGAPRRDRRARAGRGGAAPGRGGAARRGGGGGGDLLPVRLPAPGARAAGAGDRRRDPAGRLRVHLPRGRARVPRVRADEHGRGEQLSRPGDAALHRAAGRPAAGRRAAGPSRI